MRLSDAGLHQRQTEALYPNHRSSPWLTEDATRDRANRLLGNVLPPFVRILADRNHQLRWCTQQREVLMTREHKLQSLKLAIKVTIFIVGEAPDKITGIGVYLCCFG